ncbi:MAG: hypothetical protein AB9856_15170 [Cellulosilyticaceae bacterium]
MEWGKILTRLIVLFVIVNIALAIGNYNKTIKGYQLTEKRVDNIEKLLAEDHVEIKTDLIRNFFPVSPAMILPYDISPDERTRMVENILGSDNVQVTNETAKDTYGDKKRIYTKDGEKLVFDKNTIIYINENIIPKNTSILENKVKKMANTFFKKLDFGNNLTRPIIEYTQTEFGGKVTYYETHDGIPMFDSFVQVSVNEEGVFKAYVSKVMVSDKTTVKEAIYPIDKVLFGIKRELARAGYALEDTICINGITMGYKSASQDRIHILEEEVVPMYKIQIKNLETPVFVNAYTGIIEEDVLVGFYK